MDTKGKERKKETDMKRKEDKELLGERAMFGSSTVLIAVTSAAYLFLLSFPFLLFFFLYCSFSYIITENFP